MKRTIGILVALLLTGAYAWSQSGPMTPPTGTERTPQTQGTAPSDPKGFPEKEVEGRVTSVAEGGERILLDDGTQLVIPDSLRAAREVLKEGAKVKASYEEQAGQNVATSVKVWLRY